MIMHVKTFNPVDSAVTAASHPCKWSQLVAAYRDCRVDHERSIKGKSEGDMCAALNALDAALAAIKAYPASTLALLVEKLDLLEADDCDLFGDYYDAISTDVRRLKAQDAPCAPA